MKYKPKGAKVILILAMFMMIGSGLVSYFVVRKNEPIISSLNILVENKKNLIRDVWVSIGIKESRADIVTILSVLESQNTDNANQIRKYYLEFFAGLDGKLSVFENLKEIRADVKKSYKYIDDLYLDQITIQRELEMVERNNKFYSDVAFFLQMLSVLLILMLKDFIV